MPRARVSNLIWLVIIVLVVAVVGLGTWWYSSSNNDEVVVEEWQIYKNEELKYSIEYPANWHILNQYTSEDSEEAVLSSVTFASNDYQPAVVSDESDDASQTSATGTIISLRLDNISNPIPPYHSSQEILDGQASEVDMYRDSQRLSYKNLEGVSYKQSINGAEYLVNQFDIEPYILYISLHSNAADQPLAPYENILRKMAQSFSIEQ